MTGRFAGCPNPEVTFMSPSSRRIAPVALLTVVALAGAATPAAHAGMAKKTADKEAPMISAVALAPTAVALTAKSPGSTSFTVTARVADPGGVDRVVIGLYDETDKEGRSFRLARTAGTALDGTWSVKASLPNDVAKGLWSVRAFAADKASNTSDPDKVYATFAVQYSTRLRGLDVSPEPAEPKDELAAVAVLESYRPGKGWKAYDGRNVVLQFRPDGAADFAPVASATTDSAGKVSFKVKATTTGTWRIAFAGNGGYAGSVSSTDTVKIGKKAAVSSLAPGISRSRSAGPTASGT